MPVRAFKGGEGEVSAKAKDCANGGCNKAIEKRESEVVLRMNCLLVNVEVWMLVGREMGLGFWGEGVWWVKGKEGERKKNVHERAEKMVLYCYP